MSILGIDYGAKKIGLAKSNEGQSLALPLETIANTSQSAVLEKIKSVCQEHQIEKIIIGVPISLHEKKRQTFWRQKDLQNQQMKDVLQFVKWLQENINLPIEVEDERLSTKLANRLEKDLVKKNGDDAIAAMLILQTYLDKLKH